MAQVIVVGGGLSGLSAAHTVLERGGRVVLLDKNPFLGGNSTKATSGINGALTRTQIKLGIPDSPEIFYQDTARSAKHLLRPPLARVLTYQSASAVEWLIDKFGLDLSKVSRLGGQSQPRTHRGNERFPGATITFALMEKLEDIAEKEPEKARIILNARANKLVKDADGKIIGIEYAKDNQTFTEYGPVVFATGGYAADFSETSIIKKYRPDLLHLPTTNGEWSTGDGIKMTLAAGGNAVDLEKVQVHPTGLVHPDEPNAKVKFLAAEALRGVGGILLDREGQRFADDLGTRDYVTGRMWDHNKPPYRLVLNSGAGREIEWHVKHYQARGLMKFYQNGSQLAQDMGISAQQLQASFAKYNEHAKNKSCPHGKKFYDNTPFDINDSFWVAIVTPVVHFCMGGLEIDDEGRVQQGADATKKPIPGLFAGGEVAGGVHGANRLGGSSLLGCVVFGRVAGASASRYLLNELITGNPTAQRRLGVIAGQVMTPDISVALAGNRMSLQVSWGGASDAPAVAALPAPKAAAAAPAKAAPAKKEEPAKPEVKEFTRDDVAKHNTEADCWVIIGERVLDVTKFLGRHPGGKKAILIYAGKDATEQFGMIHKAGTIERYASDIVIGRLKE